MIEVNTVYGNYTINNLKVHADNKYLMNWLSKMYDNCVSRIISVVPSPDAEFVRLFSEFIPGEIVSNDTKPSHVERDRVY
jgi:hypothetical protein